MKTLKDFDFSEKRVLVRCDFNVPMNNEENILDDFKIKKSLPTIKYLISQNAKIILMSHLDALENGVMPGINTVKNRLEELLGIGVKKVDDCVGAEVETAVNDLLAGEILLLENLRLRKALNCEAPSQDFFQILGQKFDGIFGRSQRLRTGIIANLCSKFGKKMRTVFLDEGFCNLERKEETENNEEFAKQLANLGDIFINDAFAVCHRAHASVVGVPKFLPHAGGLLLEMELENLNKILKNPEHPLVVLIGGAKVETKHKFIENISGIADFVLIGGLLKKEIIGKNIKFKNPEKILGQENNLDDKDISGETIELFSQKIMQAKTILWNGPFGFTEDENFAKGTLAIAQAIIKSGAFCVVGGGQTVEFLDKEGILDKFGYVSTGGGAMLDYLSGEELPGLRALEQNGK